MDFPLEIRASLMRVMMDAKVGVAADVPNTSSNSAVDKIQDEID